MSAGYLKIRITNFEECGELEQSSDLHSLCVNRFDTYTVILKNDILYVFVYVESQLRR